MLHKFSASRQFQALSPEEQLYLLQHCNSNDNHTDAIITKLYGIPHDFEGRWHRAMYNINLRPGADRLADALMEGLMLWFAM